MTRRRRTKPHGRAGCAVALLLAALGCARAPADPPGTLRVGSSGDYAPFSVAAGDAWSGFDLAVARAFARDVRRPVRIVPFRWPELAGDVADGRFDVAMSGVTVRPERSVAGRFSVPVARSGAVVLAPPALAAGGLDGLDRAAVRIAVNAGGHLERAARARFPHATLHPLASNDTVPDALAAGDVDAVVTDTLEAPHWERRVPGAVRLGPFTRDRKAYLWATPAVDAPRLDAWLLAREADGSLAAWRERWLGAPGPPTATPLAALVAAVGERLALVPLVAEAKREAGRAVRDPEREARVLDAAWAAVRRHALAARRSPPSERAVRAFYRAQIEAAVAIQEAALAGPPAPGPRFDLADDLRPALLRVGDRLAWTLVRLEPVASGDALARAVDEELAPTGLGAAHGDALVRAILALAPRVARDQGAAPVPSLARARASSPATIGSTSEAP